MRIKPGIVLVQRVMVALCFWCTAVGTVSAGAWAPAGLVDARAQLSGGIATHPSSAGQVMILAGFMPGVAQLATFYTSNAGTAWQSNARQSITSGSLYLAGTPTIALLGDGSRVLVSTDEGRSWVARTKPATQPNAAFLLRAVNPTNPNEFFTSAGPQLFHTVDGGLTWATENAPAFVNAVDVDWSTRTLYASFLGNASLGHRPVDSPAGWDVGGSDPQAFAAGHGVVIYVNSTGSIFRSTDGGNSFNPVAQALGPVAVCRFEFAAAPSQRVYGIECTGGRILRSDDLGASWSVASTLVAPNIGETAVDAGNPDRLYVMTRDGPRVSNDGGVTFALLPRSSGAPGAGRTLFFDATIAARQWVSTDTYAFTSTLRSENNGATWNDIGQAYRVFGASRTRTNTIFGTRGAAGYDNSISLSADGGATWTEKVPYFGSHGSRIGPLIFGRAPGELFVAAFSANIGNNLSRDIFYSNNDGDTFTERFVPPIGINAMAVTPSGATVLYAGGDPLTQGAAQLYRSADGAITWQPVATFPAPLSPFGGTYGNTLNALAIDPSNTNRIFAGFVYPDYVMRSDDAGVSWVRATSGLGAGAITSLAFDPTNPSMIYASQSPGGVFRSNDNGATWVALDDGLHDEMVLGLRFDPQVAGRLYAETASGLYRTDLASGQPAGFRRAVEFFHAQFNHYFVSADLDEVAGLDAGVFQGWARTGQGFAVTEGVSPGNQPVCRFFGVGFAPLSSHFYTPYPTECEIVKADPKWLYEKIAFGLALPEPSTNGCPVATRPLYRAWNRNENGAPNHRYTTSSNTLFEMIAAGWVFEGEAQTQVFACVPYLSTSAEI